MVRSSGARKLPHANKEKEMKYRWSTHIRKLMREQESLDGYTTNQVMALLKAPKTSIYAALRSMPDTYIDRWTECLRSEPSEAVWCIIIPPQDCPKPRKKKA